MRLARPVRCSGRNGPMRRINAPLKSAMRSGSVRRTPFSSHTATRPRTVLTAAFKPLAGRAPKCPGAVGIASIVSEGDDDLAEHLPAFQAREAAGEVGKLDLGIDDGPQSRLHLGQRVADVAHRRAERAAD